MAGPRNYLFLALYDTHDGSRLSTVETNNNFEFQLLVLITSLDRDFALDDIFMPHRGNAAGIIIDRPVSNRIERILAPCVSMDPSGWLPRSFSSSPATVISFPFLGAKSPSS
jgi:hypothetical protein